MLDGSPRGGDPAHTMLKSIVSSPPVQALIAALLAGYMSLVKATTRWEVRGLERNPHLEEDED
ncbi:MAG: hypothetical protein CMH89_09705, partial [Oceanicaulis sp.]|nr:hypothetical protein [Oceanicaulis sp.]